MTIAELTRAFLSHNREAKRKAQEKASFDYILADIIGRSVGRYYNKNGTMPDISEMYPTLFDSQEILHKKQEKRAELSVLRFKQFAQSYNQKYKEEAKDK